MERHMVVANGVFHRAWEIRLDRQCSLPGDMARDLFLAAPCEVLMDYIANDQ